MRIIFTTDTIQRGGKERQLFVLARHLIDQGHEVHVIALKRSVDNYLEEYCFPFDHLHVILSKGIWRRIRECRRFFKSIKPDLVFSWDMQTALFTLILHRRQGFLFINGCIQHGVRPFKLAFLFRSLTCWLSPYVVANSLAGLRANNLKPGTRRFVLHNGIEDKFRQLLDKESRQRVRCELIPGYRDRQGIVFISVANFVPFKDYETVFRAMRELKGRYPFYYLILGDGPRRAETERQIAEAGLEANVVILGQRQDVETHLQISDYFIHSSKGEGISNAIVEAMMAGLPVIATRVGGIPETVFPGSSALFEYRNDRQLLDILKTIDERFAGFDPKSEEYARHLQEFSRDKMVSRFHQIIDLIKAQRRAS